MKKDKRFSLRLRTYYLLIIAIVVIISFGAVVGALTALQQLGVIGHINVSTSRKRYDLLPQGLRLSCR